MKISSPFASWYSRLSEPEYQRLLGEMYWRYAISIGVVLALSGVAYGAWEFFAPSSDALPAAIEKSPPSIDRDELKRVVESLEERAQRFGEIVGE